MVEAFSYKDIRDSKSNVIELGEVTEQAGSFSVYKNDALFPGGYRVHNPKSRAGDGWKLEISVRPEDLEKAFDLLMPHLIENQVKDILVANPESARLRDISAHAKAGAMISLVDNSQVHHWDRIVDGIEQILTENGIRPSVQGNASSIGVEGSRFCSYKGEKHLVESEFNNPFKNLKVADLYKGNSALSESVWVDGAGTKGAALTPTYITESRKNFDEISRVLSENKIEHSGAKGVGVIAVEGAENIEKVKQLIEKAKEAQASISRGDDVIKPEFDYGHKFQLRTKDPMGKDVNKSFLQLNVNELDSDGKTLLKNALSNKTGLTFNIEKSKDGQFYLRTQFSQARNNPNFSAEKLDDIVADVFNNRLKVGKPAPEVPSTNLGGGVSEQKQADTKVNFVQQGS